MRGLSRREFMALTGLTTPVFDARARRQQFPWGFGAPRGRAGKWYGVHWALLNCTADAFHGELGIPLTAAMKVALSISDVMWPRLADVHRTASDVTAGREPEHIMCGGYRWGAAWYPVCGTLAEILAQRQLGLTASGAIAIVSMTEAAALLIRRADAAGIDIGEVWGTVGPAVD